VPLIDREWIVGVPERIDRNGEVLTKLDIATVRAGGRRLVAEHGAEGLVVSFLWACVNDSHEQAAVDELRLAFPRLTVMSAAELLPVIREYERTQFALLNAYTSGALAGVDELVGALLDLGLPHPPLLVHSGGIHLRRRGPPGSGRSRGVRPGGRCRGGAGGLRGGRKRSPAISAARRSTCR
jgi:N-methylhydantoinase A